ncbi:MAG: DNA replication/repair protein RecF [Pseudomonadota bacterium]
MTLVTEQDHAAWVETLTLTNFRNYESARLQVGARPVVLVGENGAGKTNILEAVSLLAPGQGLRRAAMPDLARQGGDGSWAVAAKVHAGDAEVAIGTGLPAGHYPSAAPGPGSRGPSRTVRIDGETQKSSAALADFLEMVWLTPALDGLFTGAAGDRRRFLDRLVVCFDPAHSTRANQFERAMRQRNRLLDEHGPRAPTLDAIERVLAETGVALAAGRLAAIDALKLTLSVRRDERGTSPFPWAAIALEGGLEDDLAAGAAVDVEDIYAGRLAEGRFRDARAGRTLEGPHRSDLSVTHGPKQMLAKFCSTGEQKALLVGLVLAHAEMLANRAAGAAPILLLDEIAAHLDVHRRAALFDELEALGSQAWMTGTDLMQFDAIRPHADVFRVTDGAISPVTD